MIGREPERPLPSDQEQDDRRNPLMQNALLPATGVMVGAIDREARDLSGSLTARLLYYANRQCANR